MPKAATWCAPTKALISTIRPSRCGARRRPGPRSRAAGPAEVVDQRRPPVGVDGTVRQSSGRARNSATASMPTTGGVGRHGDPDVVGEQHPDRLGVGRVGVAAQDLLVLRVSGGRRQSGGSAGACRRTVWRARWTRLLAAGRPRRGRRRSPPASSRHVAQHEGRPLPRRQVHERGDQRQLDGLRGAAGRTSERRRDTADRGGPLEDVADRYRPRTAALRLSRKTLVAIR